MSHSRSSRRSQKKTLRRRSRRGRKVTKGRRLRRTAMRMRGGAIPIEYLNRIPLDELTEKQKGYLAYGDFNTITDQVYNDEETISTQEGSYTLPKMRYKYKKVQFNNITTAAEGFRKQNFDHIYSGMYSGNELEIAKKLAMQNPNALYLDIEASPQPSAY